MNDRDCIICEFTNEGESLAVGFRAWLCEKFNDEDIEEIIKSGQTVTIKWPSNVEVVPASKMQKKLKNCIWQQSVAKILAHGDWTSMCNIRENCIKYGIPNPSKEERKLIKKKVTDDSSDEEDIVKNKASTSKDANKESIMYNRRKEILKRCQETKKTNTILDDSGEKLSERDLLKELSFLREKNKKLEEDNRRLRALRAVNENLSNIQDMSKRVKKDLQEMKDMLHEMNNNAKIKSKITCENVPVSQLKHDDNNEENLNTFLFDNIELTNHNHFCDNIDGDQLIKEADILIDTTVDTSTLEPSSAINSNEQAKLIDLDGSARVMVSEVQINRCNHTSVSKLTSDLMSVVFSQTDLANSSVTGKVANIHKKKEGVKAKAKLDPLKVDAIKFYVNSKFKSCAISNIDQLINKAIVQKLNNASKNNKRTSAVHSGMGCTALNKLLAIMNIPAILNDLYKRYEREVGPAIEKAAKESCRRAAEEERRLVIQNVKRLCEDL